MDTRAQAIYVADHAPRGRALYSHSSDVEIAGELRILTRDDLHHEAMVTAGRDRICVLVAERERLRAALQSIIDEAVQHKRNAHMDGKDYAMGWEAAAGVAERALETL